MALRGAAYALRATVGAGDGIWFDMIQGVATDPHGDVWVYDTSTDVVRRFSSELALVHEFGRQGEGPGEFTSLPKSGYEFGWEGGQADWVHPTTSGVVVYDGHRVQRFTRDGEHREILDVRLPGSPPLKIMVRGDSVYHAFMSVLRPGRWTLRAAVGDVWVQRFAFDLPGITDTTMRFVSADQARPIWAGAGDCIVLTRGDVEELLLLDLATNSVELLTVPLPEPAPVDQTEERRLLGQMGIEAAPPTSVARVQNLALDPAGVLWILPATGLVDGGVEVVRVSLATGERRLDTLPAFPEAFGAEGRFYGLRAGPFGENLLSVFAPEGR